MTTISDARDELRQLLAERSVLLGEFTLKSGAKSNFYFDGRQTALHPRGASLIGQVVHALIREKEAAAGISIDAVGGLTMGADPLSVAVAIRSDLEGDAKPLNALVIRKEPKDHGAGKQVEGPFHEGDVVAVVDDTITTAGSTMTAIEAIEREGGKVAFVICLVDREEGGRENLEAKGYDFFPVFVKSEFL
ncbi:MAG: orotate phosphoribosyltransferase [Verrucomicrobiales bacterium]|jgi:orotate phosphoribosyltransferase